MDKKIISTEKAPQAMKQTSSRKKQPQRGQRTKQGSSQNMLTRSRSR